MLRLFPSCPSARRWKVPLGTAREWKGNGGRPRIRQRSEPCQSLLRWALLKSRKAGLGGDANAFQSPMILQLHTATLKEIYQRGTGFTTIAGARRNNADQLTQRILPRVDFSIRIFHGHFRNKNVLWLDV